MGKSERNELNWSECRPSESVSISRGYNGETTGAGIISVVNSAKGNGRRFELSRTLMEQLNNPVSIQVSFLEDALVIGEVLPNCTQSYAVRKGNNVYAANLVKEVTEVFGLDFSQGRVCRTFHDVQYFETEDCTVAVIAMQS